MGHKDYNVEGNMLRLVVELVVHWLEVVYRSTVPDHRPGLRYPAPL